MNDFIALCPTSAKHFRPYIKSLFIHQSLFSPLGLDIHQFNLSTLLDSVKAHLSNGRRNSHTWWLLCH